MPILAKKGYALKTSNNSKKMKIIDKENSIKLSRLISAEAGECWGNSIQAVLQFQDLVYVEGWVIGDGDYEVFEHGWVENKDFILDPTLALTNNFGIAYFPVAYYPPIELAIEILKNDDLFLPFSFQNENFIKQYRQMEKRAFELSNRLKKQKGDKK